MRLRGVRRSSNVEDRRRSGGGIVLGGGIGGLGLIALLAFGYFTGIDVTPILEQASGGGSVSESREPTAEEERAADFTTRVLATTEDVWTEIFAEDLGREYRPPVLVMFSRQTSSPCGNASGATGPFYCPIDGKAYLDTEFFATLSQELGAEGDFAAAYVVAHEVAHHVQNELGILGQVADARAAAAQTEANALTVRLELQADCLSGVWASRVNGLLEPGDMAEALNAARMIGDDRLQRRAGMVPQPHSFTHGTSLIRGSEVPQPHSFTHGTSDQREGWFATGYDSGDIRACDTFAELRP